MPAIIQYPEDLGVAADLQHMVIFFINVRDMGVMQLPGTAATDVSVVPGGPGGPNLVGGGAITRGLGAALTSAGLPNTTRLTRLDTAIALHLAEAPSASYNARYDNAELGFMGLIDKMTTSGAVADKAAAAGGIAASILARAAGAVESFKNVGPMAKIRVNPFKQTYFEEMDFRTFTFNYQFFPKSPIESEAVKRIIDLFKFHMHPELAAEGAFMVYPSEFDIAYFWGPTENIYWHRISSCVLQQVDVKYGGDQFSSFYGGQPTEVYLKLTFRETEPLTKERIFQGY